MDYPNSAKAKKLYLVLQLGGVNAHKTTFGIVEGLQEEEEEGKVKMVQRSKKKIRKANKDKKKPSLKTKQWIKRRKEKQQRLGKKVKPTTKYTGRKRNNLGLFK